MRACATCGEPADGTYCTEHRPARKTPKPSARARGYDAAWDKLSARARKLQPFCGVCGATDDLQTDHTPAAWERKRRGLSVRLQDVRVLCGPCNRDAGAARGENTRGEDPEGSAVGPRQVGPQPITLALSATSGGEA